MGKIVRLSSLKSESNMNKKTPVRVAANLNKISEVIDKNGNKLNKIKGDIVEEKKVVEVLNEAPNETLNETPTPNISPSISSKIEEKINSKINEIVDKKIEEILNKMI